MPRLDARLLDEALETLAELTADQAPRHYVVCGGSSLLALGLVSRTTTRDVDVLAALEGQQLVTASPFDQDFSKAVSQVAEELGLMGDWFNTGPSDESFFRLGFPNGIVERLVHKEFGPTLSISFISRFDQIHFKLYAAADQGPGRHLQDLRELNPTKDELVSASRWTLQHDDSEGFRFILAQTLAALGHEDIHV